uniref:Tachykinin-like peptides receptor 86C n=1 Tax=Diabrotica virgifera virgifera TaxID=50390 RepID=A0A6P7G6Z0_DIAVI
MVLPLQKIEIYSHFPMTTHWTIPSRPVVKKHEHTAFRRKFGRVAELQCEVPAPGTALKLQDASRYLFDLHFSNYVFCFRNWPFGNLYCTVSNFIANATVAASVFTLTGISCDRYLAIVYPLQPRMSKTSSIFAITFIWSASMLLALPCLLYSRTVTHNVKNKLRTGCILVWPDEKHYGSTYDLWYQMLFLVITYVIPMILMSICYTMMGSVLWGSRSIGEKTQRQIEAIKSKRRVCISLFIQRVLKNIVL